jgi:NAD+ synthase (glutamine-hydrolysing)
VLSDAHKSEVYLLGRFFDLPRAVQLAAPSADLWVGQTDTTELGFPYAWIELLTGVVLRKSESERALFRAGLCRDARHQFDEWLAKSVALHTANKHKQDFPVKL